VDLFVEIVEILKLDEWLNERKGKHFELKINII
jgi:hypothetical protein